eukprot:GEMP01033216.1.p1 GENE.GEMP01033216.1~~GEMP01033216.1.p1  ORF type:complete len:445 (+),score=103.53 GEMP01033216.1:127-1461(+)
MLRSQCCRFSLPVFNTLKERIAVLGAKQADTLKTLRKSDKVIQNVTIEQAIGGMRGIKGILTDTSSLDAEEGIRYRGMSLREVNEKLPKAAGGSVGLPEASLWLLLTGEIPTDTQVKELNAELHQRGNIPEHVMKTMDSVPITTHPMTQLSIALLALQTESKFHQQYSTGSLKKADYWHYVLDDSLSLIAKMPHIAARIYRRTFHGGKIIESNPDLDWAGNYAHMLGVDDSNEFKEAIRLYLMLHADHEGGNVSAHTTHLVASALTDPYASWSAGVCGLAGPLHGLANQECLKWLKNTMKDLKGKEPTKELLTQYAKDTLASGKVIPGFGHAVLRQTDPRYTLEFEFAKKHLANDPIFKLASACMEAIPPVLKATGKVKNPYPNVDALSGTLMQYYGLKEPDYYTVVFAVSRSLGVMAQQVWSRVYNIPIERPNSFTLDSLKKL